MDGWVCQRVSVCASLYEFV